MDYTWIETTYDVYMAIYNQHKEELSCFESYTDMGTYGKRLEAQITGWGFSAANHPIIRSEMKKSGEWKYYLLHTVEHEEET